MTSEIILRMMVRWRHQCTGIICLPYTSCPRKKQATL